MDAYLGGLGHGPDLSPHLRSRHDPVLGLEVAARAHRVDEVVGHLDALEGRLDRVGLQDVSIDNFGRRSDSRRQDGLPPHQAAHPLPVRFELSPESTSDVARRARDQNHAIHADH
jgi:hypothetical protein